MIFKSYDINNGMQTYEDRFKKFLVEADDTELTDRDAMASTLEKGTSPEDFDVDAPKGTLGQLPPSLTEFQRKMHRELQVWVNQMEEFTEFLNGTGPESIQTKLNSAEDETLFKKISDAETKKISRVAMELSSLVQALKGYLATSNSPKFRGQ